MKRSQFLALMLSPLIAPFVKAEEQRVTYPNGAKIHWFKDPVLGSFESLDNSVYISEAERKMWLDGTWDIREQIILRHRGNMPRINRIT